MGIHLGQPGSVRIEPAPWGTGLVAAVGGRRVPVHVDHARADPGSTVLVGPSAEWRTPEHVLAALVGAGVTDAVLVVAGPEAPALDGSSLGWWQALHQAGFVDGPPVAPVQARALRIEAFGGVAEAWPASGGRAEVEVAFDGGGPRGEAAVALDGRGFEAVADARTFVLDRDVEPLRAAGRGLGATAANTVVWHTDGGPTSGLRSADEPVRHKLLDLVGDLALLGGPLAGRVRVVRGSHRLHHALVRALLG